MPKRNVIRVRAAARPSRRDGVVLLIVLVAIVVLGTALAQVAGSNAQARIGVLRQQRGLQQRWGMLSVQRVVLPASAGALSGSDSLSKQSNSERHKLPHQVADEVVLGGQHFSVLLADEDAKANLNTIYDLGGTSACQKTLRSMIDIGDLRSIQMRPQRRSEGMADAGDSRKRSSRLAGNSDDDEPVEAEYLPPAFRSWGDVLDYSSVVEYSGDVRKIAKTTQNVTLWGSGRLNVWRASDDAIIAVCREVVQDGLARRIQQRLRTARLAQVDLVLRQTVTNEEDRKKVASLLADNSQCASLWVEASDGQTRRQQLSILVPDETGLIRTIVFQYP